MFLQHPGLFTILTHLFVVLMVLRNGNKRSFQDTSAVNVTTVDNIAHDFTILKFNKLVFNDLRHLTSLLLSLFSHEKFESFSGCILSRLFFPELNDSSHLLITEFRDRSRFNRPVFITISREKQVRQTRVNRTNLSTSDSNECFRSVLVHTRENFRRIDTLVLPESFHPLVFNFLTSSYRLVKAVLHVGSKTRYFTLMDVGVSFLLIRSRNCFYDLINGFLKSLFVFRIYRFNSILSQLITSSSTSCLIARTEFSGPLSKYTFRFMKVL